EVSPGGLLQNELVQRQIRDCLAEPAVLELKILQALHLLALQPAKLLAPPIICHLAHPDLADCVHHVLALRNQNIHLPQLRDDLFRLVSLPCHCSPPGCQRHTSSRTTSMGVDHSVTMRANRKCRRKDLSRRKIPRFNPGVNAPSRFSLKNASIKTEAVLGKRGNAGFSGKSRAASVEIESTINPTGL